jgi:UDP-N-acetylglucosamine 2-epimerase (non-hydrolysing)
VTGLRVLVAYGTRPEAVKMAPLVQVLASDPRFRTTVVVTGQHREMLDQVNQVFGIRPDVDLDIHAPGQTLADITTRSLQGIGQILARHDPDAVVVQGDTTTTLAVALAAHYHKVPVIHLEAGLRTDDRYAPHPEEINRRLTTQLASVHLAPTDVNRRNLLRENVSPASVVVTGNTVIDALHWTVRSHRPFGHPELERVLASDDRRMLLVTAHRRESWGGPMRSVAQAVRRLAARFDDHLVVFPMHRNPVVRDAMVPILTGLANVHLVEPLPYAGFCRLMSQASLILTDSGGIQEEGPSLGKPVLVLRDTTERPEAVAAGTVGLIGTDEEAIVTAVTRILTEPDIYTRMANAVNPYGDGAAAARGAAAIAHYFGRGPRPEDFGGGSIGGEPIDLTQGAANPRSPQQSPERSRDMTEELRTAPRR